MIDIKVLENDPKKYNQDRLNDIIYEDGYLARELKIKKNLRKGLQTWYKVEPLPTFKEDYKLINQFKEYRDRVNFLIRDLGFFATIDPTKEILEVVFKDNQQRLQEELDAIDKPYSGYHRPQATHCFNDSDNVLVYTKDINFGMRLRYLVDPDEQTIYLLFCIGHNPEERERLRNMSLTYLSTETNTKLFSEGTMSAKEQWLKEHPLPKVLQDYKMPIFLKDNEVSPLTNQQKELMKKAFQYQYMKKPILKEKSFPTKQEFESLGIKGTFI